MQARETSILTLSESHHARRGPKASHNEQANAAPSAGAPGNLWSFSFTS